MRFREQSGHENGHDPHAFALCKSMGSTLLLPKFCSCGVGFPCVRLRTPSHSSFASGKPATLVRMDRIAASAEAGATSTFSLTAGAA